MLLFIPDKKIANQTLVGKVRGKIEDLTFSISGQRFGRRMEEEQKRGIPTLITFD
jgi:hypothetical protein